ncbi:hypothetical protein [Sporomusa acidovorans]|uniref:Uncharacterized protein n=1 Tax=Sporomusa acidovorans (strain ATCC 49682 / DSM 3132 / Mol) TaxID=1123286 RepID=A0ABZ3J8W6_SPOA4|nr:hypothetical protein [Sporomusa acidovorans]OZC14091.1 hypothetical protein SPACI_53860 [Sporomusa acidovorans DSM 3132]SDF87318.1 hypothetical protein SAMN04488499_11113 [Sporomusa acidovorans]
MKIFLKKLNNWHEVRQHNYWIKAFCYECCKKTPFFVYWSDGLACPFVVCQVCKNETFNIPLEEEELSSTDVPEIIEAIQSYERGLFL